MNISILLGRLTKDPVYKKVGKVGAEDSCANFTLAVDRKGAKKDPTTGNKPTDFINIVAWKGLADFVNNYLSKGRQICVSGSIRTRNYVSNTTQQKVYVTEIVADTIDFADSKPANQQTNLPQQANNVAIPVDPQDEGLFIAGDEELPFNNIPVMG